MTVQPIATSIDRLLMTPEEYRSKVAKIAKKKKNRKLKSQKLLILQYNIGSWPQKSPKISQKRITQSGFAHFFAILPYIMRILMSRWFRMRMANRSIKSPQKKFNKSVNIFKNVCCIILRIVLLRKIRTSQMCILVLHLVAPSSPFVVPASPHMFFTRGEPCCF